MTIFVNDVKGMTAIEVEFYRLNEETITGEFITVNGRKGIIIPYDKKDKKAISALYTPFHDPHREVRFNTIEGGIDWVEWTD